jgi:hypothetical protein
MTSCRQAGGSCGCLWPGRMQLLYSCHCTSLAPSLIRCGCGLEPAPAWVHSVTSVKGCVTRACTWHLPCSVCVCVWVVSQVHNAPTGVPIVLQRLDRPVSTCWGECGAGEWPLSGPRVPPRPAVCVCTVCLPGSQGLVIERGLGQTPREQGETKLPVMKALTVTHQQLMATVAMHAWPLLLQMSRHTIS